MLARCIDLQSSDSTCWQTIACKCHVCAYINVDGQYWHREGCTNSIADDAACICKARTAAVAASSYTCSTSARVVPHLVERLKADASGTHDQQQLLGQASQLHSKSSSITGSDNLPASKRHSDSGLAIHHSGQWKPLVGRCHELHNFIVVGENTHCHRQKPSCRIGIK
jgi:hypothetical protein